MKYTFSFLACLSEKSYKIAKINVRTSQVDQFVVATVPPRWESGQLSFYGWRARNF